MKNKFYLLCGLVTCSFIFILSINYGTYTIQLSQIWAILQNPLNENYYTLVEYRLPRAILSILIGAALALAGTLVQGVILNPLASPEILGINNASGLAAVVMIVFFPSISIYILPLVSFLASLFSLLILWLITKHNFSTIKMALVGIALSALYAAITNYVLLVNPIEINMAMLWLTGSLWGRSWPFIFVLVPWLLILFPIAFLLAKPLDILILGEEKASSLGLSVFKIQIIILIIALLLTASSISVCGPIAFLGLVAPHLARKLVGNKHLILIPTSMLIGAILLQLSDILARIIIPPIELPAGIITSIIGAPYFFWLLIKGK